MSNHTAAKCIFGGNSKGVMVELLSQGWDDACELACRPQKGLHFTRWPRRMYPDRAAGLAAFAALSAHISGGGDPKRWLADQGGVYTLSAG